jgi:hypothetical protein
VWATFGENPKAYIADSVVKRTSSELIYSLWCQFIHLRHNSFYNLNYKYMRLKIRRFVAQEYLQSSF